MRRSNPEFWLAFITILLMTLFYLFGMNALRSVPAAGGLFGHSIGVLGFLLMLMTETLYSLRKRTRKVHWGRMSTWLRFHIFTGLVGPYMVLLHSSWKFNGLAGVVMLFTIIIVISGFIGRYIYTAIPRSVDGAEIGREELERQIRALEADYSQVLVPAGVGLRSGPVQIQKLRAQKDGLQRQVESLAHARRLLGLWHSVHVPIGMVLFSTALIHIGAALYYATFLH